MKQSILILKIVVPTVLLGYLFSTQTIDLRRLTAIQEWYLIIGALVVLVAQLALAVWRWQTLLASQDIDASFAETVRLSLIGMFFSIVLPGAVSGDVAKGIYIARSSPHKRAAAVSTVVLDRWIGLLALLCVDGLFFVGLWLFAFNILNRYPLLRSVSLVFGSLFVLFLIVTFCLFSRSIRKALHLDALIARLPFARYIAQLMAILANYRDKYPYVLKAFALSLAVQIITPIVFILFSVALAQRELPWYFIALFVPIVMTTNALPISIMGLGVGEAAMITLFSIVLPASVPNLGGEMMVLFRVLTILISLPGGALWMFQRKHINLRTVEPAPSVDRPLV